MSSFAPQQFHLPMGDGDIVSFVSPSSDWEIYETDFGFMGKDAPIIYEMMEAAEAEYNENLDHRIDCVTRYQEEIDRNEDKWYTRLDAWEDCEGANPCPSFMLWPIDGEIQVALEESEIETDYLSWINSKQFIKSLEAYNFHKLLAFEKGFSPIWVGECTGDKAKTHMTSSNTCVLYESLFRDRFMIDAVVRTGFPNQGGGNGYIKASSPYGDIYIPNKFKGYIGQVGEQVTLTVALQDVGSSGRKANGFRWTCIFNHTQ